MAKKIKKEMEWFGRKQIVRDKGGGRDGNCSSISALYQKKKGKNGSGASDIVPFILGRTDFCQYSKKRG
ncbi:MAG TPA: hypothetical protein IAB71_04790 [Candidatus Scatomonas pullistercoris]|uniref:Uncharacterized protein n=1 Tax=Candidatus Scatomonas pullistercoris TaxID=2840920 RepID=A0A9D1P256_9FIRM|nr:hypothetical protein [Candidatus Scatomonas pullistercoris]